MGRLEPSIRLAVVAVLALSGQLALGSDRAAAAECVLVFPSGSDPNDPGVLTLGGADSTLSISSTACGFGATVEGGSGSSAFGFDADASGTNSQSSAFGAFANASGIHGWHTAIGAGANASGDDTDYGDGLNDGPAIASNIAIGRASDASGDDETNIAIGYSSKASGSSIAIGTGAVATGSIAIGAGAQAGNGGTAIGDNSSATFANSAAWGEGATATRDGQQSFGTAANTYTMAGIVSQASRDAQSGATYFVTSDGDGNLATTSFDIGGFETQLGELGDGVAMAMALGGAILPAGKSFAITSNVGHFNGSNALGVAAIGKITDSVYLNAGGALGFNTNSFGGRAGVTVAW